jgi:hypothetical protein
MYVSYRRQPKNKRPLHLQAFQLGSTTTEGVTIQNSRIRTKRKQDGLKKCQCAILKCNATASAPITTNGVQCPAMAILAQFSHISTE